MKYFLIAGEASGDLHGSNLMKSLKTVDQQASFAFWGGDMMKAVEPSLLKHYSELAFMGFVEVLMNLRTILRNIKTCKAQIEVFQPDALILIDYPGFNLRIAKWAKEQGYKVFYYISPQIWAWHTSRVHQIKANVDRMFVILPFEQEFYAKYQVEVDFVGHPLIDAINTAPQVSSPESTRIQIALLPGSRKQEISRMLSVMLEVAKLFPEYQFTVAGAPSQPKAYYEALFLKFDAPQNVSLLEGKTYELLQKVDAALVTSGTATLETALFKVPQVVCYRGNPLSFAIAKQLVDIEYISLVNLIMSQALVEELIQKDFTVNTLKTALIEILEPETQSKLKKGYEELWQKLGSGGASQHCAELIYKYTVND